MFGENFSLIVFLRGRFLHPEFSADEFLCRYLIQELHGAVSGRCSSLFRPADRRGKWRLQPGVSFLLFTSHTPCGDASIIPMTDSQAQPCPLVTSVSSCGETDGGQNLKRKAKEPGKGGNLKLPRLAEEDSKEEEESRTKSPDGVASVPASASELKPGDSRQSDVHRTGAKCVPGAPADPLRPGAVYHSTGVLRVKPGRGEPTLSLSCSDKLARWGVLGFQGALLSHYLEEALYFDTVVVGKCPYSQEVMHRALVTRCSRVSELPAGFSVCSPLLLQSSLEFPFSQNQTELQHQGGQGRISACGAAISWCNVADQPLDVTANGYKHGVTKKVLGTPKARSLLCKLELFHSFLSLVAATDPSALPDSLRSLIIPHLKTKLQFPVTWLPYQRVTRKFSSLCSHRKKVRRAAHLLGPQAGLPVVPAGLAAAASAGLPSVAPQRQKPPPVSLKADSTAGMSSSGSMKNRLCCSANPEGHVLKRPPAGRKALISNRGRQNQRQSVAFPWPSVSSAALRLRTRSRTARSVPLRPAGVCMWLLYFHVARAL
ncbi:tRNA-specific adenosine deaminase 1 isoform X2 [Poecilia reticulata]|uniref:tRNA-specific adenosine deaminase 1 isoform X2 n=1 Tax=Poecilia reticulata TaxID=8081 RepID=UPI0007EB9483|nr:PREDICTED: tRNA-specific adenosine deaminase 1 isoform X2 [Poecilia reticulata]